jgi:tRNA threonylcarbamoyl adenosine modification protein YeaZ
VKVLGLDTATSTAGIAIVDGDRVLGEARHDTRGRGADLLVKIDEVCRAAGVAPGALDAIAIGAGPGSFTGLRIGMATAKGIAFAANRPLWAVSSLAALAGDALEELGPLAAHGGWLAARTPSGRAVARLALAGARADITIGGAPTYIRPSEAEVKYPDGVPGALRRR